jgi:DNA-binding Lrp family transcriptional regulator
MAGNTKEYDIPLSILSIKDRKILKELFINARTPFSIIAKRVGLSKEVVNYRVKKLIERGILIRFNTIIDVQKLGWQIYFINIQLRNIDNAVEEAIIADLTAHSHVAQVLKCIGNYDLILKVFVKDYVDAHNIVKELETKFKNHINEYVIDLVEQEVPVPLPFFYEPFKITGKVETSAKSLEPYVASETDLHILKALSHDARLPATEIATQMNISRELVRHHLKKLEKNGVIQKYRPSAWSGSKSIGYSWYVVMLKLNETNKNAHKRLQYYITHHPNMTYYYKSIGQHDVQFEVRLKTSDELNQILMEVRTILKDELKSHELAIILKESKYTYFPGCLHT